MSKQILLSGEIGMSKEDEAGVRDGSSDNLISFGRGGSSMRGNKRKNVSTLHNTYAIHDSFVYCFILNLCCMIHYSLL